MKQEATLGNGLMDIFQKLSPGYLDETVLNILPAAVLLCNLQGHIKKYNEQFVNVFGIEPAIDDKVQNLAVLQQLYSTDENQLPLHQNPIMACLANGQSTKAMEVIMQNADRSKIFVQLSAIPLKDNEGRQVGSFNCFYNITQQKKTEQQLQESEKKLNELTMVLEHRSEERGIELRSKNVELHKSETRYHKMVEEVEDYAIILLDKNGIVQNWNKGAEKIKGYKEEEIVGKSFEQFYLPDDRQKKLPGKLIKQAAETGKAVHEGWRMRKDGTKFWGSIVLTALHDDHHKVIGFSKVTRDLTERKIAEDKMTEYTQQLKFQNEQLEQFAYAASHDMKEPLRKILFYNNHLWEKAATILPEKEKEYLARSLNAAKRMQNLIDDLLEYSKASLEKHNFDLIDLNEIIDELVLSHKEILEEKEATIIFSKLPVIEGVSFQLRQLFDNLISNAIKYSLPQRKPVININAVKIQNSNLPELDHNKEYYQISVCDNGIGFEPEFAEKIFELFHRLGTNKYSGTGVGLALCKKIVQNHHGTIVAKGQVNEGACFDIYLPA